MRIFWLILCSAPLAASPAAAEVKSATEQGFEVGSVTTIAAPPTKVYAALVDIGSWWNPDHSFSGDAKNMTIDSRPGGCFCEKLPDGGGVEHMRVAYVQPGQVLRLRGGLGPLQGEGVEGALTWTLKPAGAGTAIEMSYVVGGYVRMGAAKLAPLVDMVLGEQMARLKAEAEKTAK